MFNLVLCRRKKNPGTRKFSPEKRPTQMKANAPSIYGFRHKLVPNSTLTIQVPHPPFSSYNIIYGFRHNLVPNSTLTIEVPPLSSHNIIYGFRQIVVPNSTQKRPLPSIAIYLRDPEITRVKFKGQSSNILRFIFVIGMQLTIDQNIQRLSSIMYWAQYLENITNPRLLFYFFFK